MRRVDVFFYGLFMDETILRSKGADPHDPERAAVDGFSLRIGNRAALVRTAGGRVHGLLFSVAARDLERIYSEPSLQAYEPEAVLARLEDGTMVPALCYNLPLPPAPHERNADYAEELRVVARNVGLPEEYVASL
ncbi:MAG TPA: gamma-glutamylcyclotransferase family protein [Vicinamibacterales bacterium]|jgi:hypothetical protein